MTRLTFTLDGRDQLSRVLDGAGTAADRLGRRLLIAGIDGEAAMARLGRATTQRMAAMQRDATTSAQKIGSLRRSLVSLAPAAVPAAASLAPIAAGAGAVAIAAVALTAALGPQIAAMRNAAEAEKTYRDAVEKSGARSKEAVAAQAEYARAVAKLPPETRRAAAALSVATAEYKAWSDALAGDTMGPVTKSFALFSGLLPKTSGLVRSTSSELDRMMTILAGGMETPGFDRLNQRFEAFAASTLRRVNEGLLELAQTDTSEVGSGAAEFMAFARAQGPAVGETLRSVAQALTTLLVAGADVGVGLLQVINVLAQLVGSVPPEAIAALLQLAIAIKAVTLAAAGTAAARAALAALGVQMLAMSTAAAAAPGRLAAVGAAVGALSRTAKLAAAGTGIGLLLIGLSQLSQVGKSAPPDIDKLTTSLGNLGRTGKASGTVAAEFGADFEKLREQIAKVLDPSVAESVNNWGATITGGLLDAGDATEEFTRSVDSIDSALAQLVSSGKADQARAALAAMLDGMDPEQAAKLRSGLDGYKEALASLRFEQQLAADAAGLFGAQAQDVQAKLDAQKRSTDGLRDSLIALNEVQRAATDGRAGMEAAIDAAAAGTKRYATALRMSGGELNLSSEAARSASTILNDLARKTENAVTSARESGRSWDYARGQYERGRGALIRAADAMGLSRAEARRYADQILKTPNKTAYIRGDLADLKAKLAKAKADLARVPDSRKASVQARIDQLQAAIRQARADLASIDGRTATTRVVTEYSYVKKGPGPHKSGYVFADGGLVRGPGTSTSDSIDARLSNNEFVIRAASVARYGVAFLNAINEGRLSPSSLGTAAGATVVGTGSMAGAGAEAGRGLSAGLRGSTGGVESSARVMAAAVVAGVKAELEIKSPSKKMEALAKDTGKGMIKGLTGAKSQIKATARDLVKDIWAAWKGMKSPKDSVLAAMVTQGTAVLQSLAGRRDELAARIKTAKTFAADTTARARQSSALSSLGIDDEKVTAGSIKGGLQQKLSKLKSFVAYVKTLAKRGLSKTLLKQILEMGPEDGYAYASALAGADAATFKSINSLQSELNKGADSLGKAGADLLYDSGRDSGKGFLAGLTSQQDAIEAQMLKIAKAMETAIRKALGLKTPKAGRHSTEGLALGLTEQLPVLDQALATVTGRVASAQPVIGRAAVVGASAQPPVSIQIDVHGAMDPIAVGREIRRTLLSLKRDYGVNVNLGVA
ncbi:hypothetical protein [Streptomyces jumonjinensis]|uniref:Phage tail tape measure protein n=1 Tax=Streptomyces jumonjinensis TaxID=1945 RepID=A0A646KM73_STRJU|nr:hypothetical protein [Streptomyces jumonjinensis]MQT03180.1 hypothetical protein [Streptomyces jumonjinensis]